MGRPVLLRSACRSSWDRLPVRRPSAGGAPPNRPGELQRLRRKHAKGPAAFTAGKLFRSHNVIFGTDCRTGASFIYTIRRIASCFSPVIQSTSSVSQSMISNCRVSQAMVEARSSIVMACSRALMISQ